MWIQAWLDRIRIQFKFVCDITKYTEQLQKNLDKKCHTFLRKPPRDIQVRVEASSLKDYINERSLSRVADLNYLNADPNLDFYFNGDSSVRWRQARNDI